MKIYLLLTLFLLTELKGKAQLMIGNGAQWVNSGAVMININDLDFKNDGIFLSSSSLVKFTGNINNTISGNSSTSFNEIEIAKSAANKLLLNRNTTIQKRLIFTSGLFDLNNFNLDLTAAAKLDNESAASRIIGPSGGEVIMSTTLNAPVSENPGNLGAIITTASNLGAVTIKRGHKTPAGNGLATGINRYYDISPSNNAGLNATFRFQYFDPELNNQDENSLVMFKSINGGLNWTNESFSTRDVNLNYVEKSGIDGFSKWALASPGVIAAPDLTSSQFFSTTQLSPGTVVDECIVIRNVGNAATTAPVSFSITNYSALSGLTISVNNAPSVIIGIDNYVLDNSNWTFDLNSSTITSNIGISIPPGGSRNIGLRISRGNGLQAGANGSVTQTTTIAAGTGGGDQYIFNNSISNTLLKN
jgi:hypothetical protein